MLFIELLFSILFLLDNQIVNLLFIWNVYYRCYTELARYIRRITDDREKNQLTGRAKNRRDDFRCVPTKQKVRKYARK